MVDSRHVGPPPYSTCRREPSPLSSRGTTRCRPRGRVYFGPWAPARWGPRSPLPRPPRSDVLTRVLLHYLQRPAAVQEQSNHHLPIKNGTRARGLAGRVIIFEVHLRQQFFRKLLSAIHLGPRASCQATLFSLFCKFRGYTSTGKPFSLHTAPRKRKLRKIQETSRRPT